MSTSTGSLLPERHDEEAARRWLTRYYWFHFVAFACRKLRKKSTVTARGMDWRTRRLPTFYAKPNHFFFVRALVLSINANISSRGLPRYRYLSGYHNVYQARRRNKWYSVHDRDRLEE